jgi:hypothetical protein
LFSIALISARQRYGSLVCSHGKDGDDDDPTPSPVEDHDDDDDDEEAHGRQSSEHPRGKPSYPIPTILPNASTTHAPPPLLFPRPPPRGAGSFDRRALRHATAKK